VFVEYPSQEILDRFKTFFSVGKENECWEWTGCINSWGYGQFKLGNDQVNAHRAAYFINNPNFDQSLQVLHSCDNRKCVNPKHLCCGTLQENMTDKVNKNRHSFGEGVTNSFLLEHEVLEIKEKYATGKFSLRKLGRIYQVSHVQIANIVNNKQWRSLQPK
jgi:hypothetical protein